MNGRITVSPKHGVNPCIPKCFFCQEDKNELVLMGKLPGDVEAPRGAVFDRQPCDKCLDLMEKGIILISVNEAKTGEDKQNPWRSGGWVVITEDAFRRMASKDSPEVERICQMRMAFVPDEVWDAIGLPRTAKEAAPLLVAPDDGAS